MSVHFATCEQSGLYRYILYETDNDIKIKRFLHDSFRCEVDTLRNLTVYTSVNATFSFDLRTREYPINYNPLNVFIRLESLPEFYSILQVEFTTVLNGSVSTPNWDGVTSSFWLMDTWLRLTVPEGHGVMVSVADIDIGPNKCSTVFFLGLYQHLTSDPYRVYCGKLKQTPSVFSAYSGFLYIRFTANFRKTRFKALFSFHPNSLMLTQHGNGTWNCTVPQWPEFRHHFPCNLQADCVGQEDEALCPYTTPGCGVGRVTVAGRCYVFTIANIENRLHGVYERTSWEKVSWDISEMKCRGKGGHLPSFSSFRNLQNIRDFLTDKRDIRYIFVGMFSSEAALPSLYKNLWTHVDGSIAHYVKINNNLHFSANKLESSCRRQESDSALLFNNGIFQISRACRIQTMVSLCEVPPISKDDSPDAQDEDSSLSASHWIWSENKEQANFWWDENSYLRCPANHLTHLFLACDVNSACWVHTTFNPVHCNAPVTPLPPSMMCDDGKQHVSYSLVCNHRPDCSDRSDEDFCDFTPCDIMTEFGCTDKMCLPLAVKCNGIANCNDASDELRCHRTRNQNHKTGTLPPALLTFDGLGNSDVRSLTETLSLDGVSVNGTLVKGRLVDASLIGDTLVNGTFDRGTLVYGTLVSGVLIRGTLTSGILTGQMLDNGIQPNKTLADETVVSGTLVAGVLLNAKLVKGAVVSGTLINATLVSGTATCPDTHFQCATDDYCVPIFTRCNGLFECPGHQDEVACDTYQCPGFYRCRGATVCVHRRNMCDGVYHCPQKDDEMMCNLTCPDSCTCYGLAFFCPRVTPVYRYPKLRYLNATDSKTRVYDLQNNTMLIYLSLVRCGISNWGPITLPNLRSLDLSDNNVTKLTSQLISNLPNLRHLMLAHNPFTSDFLSDMSVTLSLPSLSSLDLSGSDLLQLDPTVLSLFPNLHTLNLTGCGINRVLGDGFQLLKQLRVLDLRGCPMTYFPKDVFHGLGQLRAVYGDNYKLCCQATLPGGFYLKNCKAPSDEVSSCEALLRSNFFRICICIFSILSCTGNLSSLLFRLKTGKKKFKTGFDMFVFNLCVSDLLMGVYLIIIGVADRSYLRAYLWHDVTWRHSPSCQAAGVLSLLSNEVSTLIICLITLDRFIVFRFPFSQFRFSTTTAFFASALVWVICFLIAAVPLLPMTSHWQFYSQTGICIPLPINRSVFEGHRYAFSVMIMLNFVLFLMVALGQLFVYMSVHKHKMPSIEDTPSGFKKNQTLARRLITVAVSNFLCWFPIGLVGMMAANGFHVPGEVNVAMAIFALPLNSAINPFLYTLNIALEKRRQSREGRMKQFLLSQIKTRTTLTGSVIKIGSTCTHDEALQLLKQWVGSSILSRGHIMRILRGSETNIPLKYESM